MTSIINYFTGHSPAREEIARSMRWSNIHAFDSDDIRNFFTLRDGLLNRAVAEGRLDARALDRIKDFGFDCTNQICYYTNPSTTLKEYVAFEEITDRTILSALNQLRAKSKHHFGERLSEIQYSPKSKGNLAGSKALNQNTTMLKSLPKDFETAANELLAKYLITPPANFAGNIVDYRKTVVRRVQLAEFTINKLKVGVDEKIATKEQEHKGAAAGKRNDASAMGIEARLRRELQELKQFKADLDGINVYALTMAMIGHPVGHYWPQDFSKAVGSFEQLVKADLRERSQVIVENNRKWFAPKQAAKLDVTEESFATDVVGLMYKSRSEYWGYCEQKKISRMKKEGLEDVILRVAIRNDNGGYKADGFKDAICFDQFPDALKGEMDTLLDDVAAMANEAIPADSGTYQDATIAADIVTQRGKINWKIAKPSTFLQRHPMIIPAAGAAGLVVLAGAAGLGVLPSPSTALTLAQGALPILPLVLGAKKDIPELLPSRETARNIALTTVGTVAVASLMAYGGYIPPESLSNVYEMLKATNPAMAVALYATARKMVAAADAYVRPQEPETTGVSLVPIRRVNKKRVLAVLTGAIALGMAAYAYSTSVADPQNDDPDKHSYAQQMTASVVQGTQAVVNWAWEHNIATGLAFGLAKTVAQPIAARTPAVLNNVVKGAAEVVNQVAAVSRVVGLAKAAAGYIPASVSNTARAAVGGVAEAVTSPKLMEKVASAGKWLWSYLPSSSAISEAYSNLQNVPLTIS